MPTSPSFGRLADPFGPVAFGPSGSSKRNQRVRSLTSSVDSVAVGATMSATASSMIFSPNVQLRDKA